MPTGRPLTEDRFDPETLVERGALWTVVLNRNQNLLGKSMLVANRPVTHVTALTTEEWADLHRQIARVTAALERAFRPDHFNYAFLQNQDRQVHLHVIPRYADARSFDGQTFEDPDYPAHYAVPTPARHLDVGRRAALVAVLRRCLSRDHAG